MNFQRWEVRAERRRFQFEGIEIMIRMRASREEGPDYMMTFTPREIKQEDQGRSLNEDEILTVPDQLAQNLMDQLWLCGLRPTEGTGSAGSLAATQRHLGDMQKLSWQLLDMVDRQKDTLPNFLQKAIKDAEKEK
jgi:hypothetical protein